MAATVKAGGGKDGRAGRPRRRRGRVLAAKGARWELWFPVDQWDKMTDQERADRVKGQAALMKK